MQRLINRAFNIRAHEWPRTLLLSLMHFLANGGVIWCMIITEAAFLRNIGVERLSWVFIASPLASILAISLYTAFADRVSNTVLLVAILLIAALGYIAGLVLYALGWAAAAYALWYPLTLSFIDIFFTLHWGTYVNSFYDTQAVKRVFPVVSAAARIAAIVAGVTIGALSRLAPPAIMLIWIGLMLLVAGLAWRLPALLRQPGGELAELAPAPAAGPPASYSANMREGLRYVAQSAFLRWMALATLCIYVLFALLNYQAGRIFLRELQTIDRIAGLTGLLNSLGNLLMFPVLLFGLSRLIGWLGVGSASLIFPLGTLAIGGGLLAAPGLPTAGLAYFGRTAFRVTFHATFDSLLYNAVPLRVKGRARAFITGLVVPLGTLLGGLLLLALAALPAGWQHALPGLIGALALAYLGCALMVRRHYARALLRLVEHDDFSSLLDQPPADLAVGDTAAQAALSRRLAGSPSHEVTLFSANLLAQLGGGAAAPAIERAARAAASPRTRAALLELLAASAMRGAGLRQLYRDLLGDPDPAVRRAALAGLAQLTGSGDPQFLSLALAMLDDPDADVRAVALAPLARSGDFFFLAPAVEALGLLFADADPAKRARAIRVLAQLDDARVTRSLLRHLHDPADQVRLQAVVAIDALTQASAAQQALRQIGARAQNTYSWLAATLQPAAPTSQPVALRQFGQRWQARVSQAASAAGPLDPALAALLAPELASLADDPVERVRELALSILGRLGAPASYPALVAGLGDASPAVRDAAVAALVSQGRPAVPAIEQALGQASPQLRRLAAVALSRIDRGAFGALAASQAELHLAAIEQAHAQLAALAACPPARSAALLQSLLRERCARLAGEILDLLAEGAGQPTAHMIGLALVSGDARAQANASEALESLASPQLARRLAPLLAQNARPPQPAELCGQAPAELAAVLPELCAADEPLLRAAAACLLGELGTALVPPAPTIVAEPVAVAEPAPASPRRSRRAKAAALLDALAAPEPPTAVAEPPAPGPLPLTQIAALLAQAAADPDPDVRAAAQVARRDMAGQRLAAPANHEEATVLSTIERILFLKEVPFFQGMAVEHLRVLAAVCEEHLFAAESRIFEPGDPGGALYLVVNGRVGIEQERRKGSFARIATVEAHAYFGEMNLFDDSPRALLALALHDTLTLRLRREPLIALARRHPELSLELINVLSQRLREANERVAELTRSKPRELQKLYDQFD